MHASQALLQPLSVRSVSGVGALAAGLCCSGAGEGRGMWGVAWEWAACAARGTGVLRKACVMQQ